MLEIPGSFWKDYELLDSGRGEKLERFGHTVLIRPEPKALWDKTLPDAQWLRQAHFAFRLASAQGSAKSGSIEDRGTWERIRKSDEQWYISYPGEQKGLGFELRLGLTAFKHVGVFPEQAPNWEYIYRQVKRLNGGATPVKVLNLFAYTGGASLAAKAAGADVTHLDSVRQVVTWARGNMETSGMDGIRWVVEDAMKFVQREARRGNLYDGIILDPPAYGHGPDGEKWKLDESLFGLLQGVSRILRPGKSFMVLNLYSNGYSAALGETLVREAFALTRPDGKDAAGILTSGELALKDGFGKVLPLSIYVRLER